MSGAFFTTAGTWKDPDGVQMSSTFQYLGNGIDTSTYTDTLGQTVLIATYGPSGGSSPDTYTYFDANGNQRTLQVNYTVYPQRTNFGCQPGADFNFGNVYFPTSVVLPDGETFSLSYEPTPGYPGSVTGRLAQLTLPTGGYVAYSYSGSSGQGMNCDTQMSTITRTVNDGRGNSSQWTYVPAFSGANYMVTETDPASNTITYQFYPFVGRKFQTEKTVADPHGNLLSTTITCYNGNNTSQSACIAPQNFGIVTQTDVYTSLGSGTPSLVETIYDHNPLTTGGDGNVLTVKRWNVGTYPPSGSPVSTTTNTFANINGVTCGSTMQYIVDHPCTSTTTNSSGATVSQTKFTYNSGGHPTQTQNWVGGTTFLTSSATFNANGTISTSTDTNGQVTNYAYNGTGGCNNLLPTSTSTVVNGVTLTSSQTWNCFGGVTISATDANSKITQYSYLDQNGVPDPLWRLRSTTDPLGNVTVNTYSPLASPPTGESSMLFNSGQSIADTLTTYDGLGRPILHQTRQAPGSTNFDTVVTTYDLLGRVSSTSLPCVSTASVTCSSPANTTTSFDALNRPLQVTDAGGGYTQYSYTQSGSVLDTLITVGPAPAGENLKKRQLESDNQGRLTSVCEIAAASGSGSCAQAVAGTGYRTVYTYDALDRLTAVTQNAQGSPIQTRTYAYDGLSRMTSETNPESGTKTYTYDSFSSSYCASTSAGDLVATSGANGSVSCNYYDGLHRLTTAAAWTSGLLNGLCRRFAYDSTLNGVLGSAPAGVSVTNVANQLVEAETDNCAWPITQSSMITDEWFGYSARSEKTDMYESTPHSGRYYHSSVGYFANGGMQSLSFFGQSNPYTYGLDGEGRPYTASQTTNQLVTSTTYNAASQPLTVSLKLGDSDNYAYDPNTGRMTNYTFTVGSTPKSMVGGLTWNANGTLSKLAITDGFNASGAQTCKYGDPTSSVAGYDDLARLINTNCGALWSQTFSYDPFGNITKSGSVAWMPGYNQSTNRYVLGGTSYDASGNLLNDTFHTYTWDGFGKVMSIDSTACGSNGICFTYDAFGQLVEKNASGVYSQIEYSPTGKVAVLNSGGTWVRGYVPLPGGEILAPAPDTFWHMDWLGSARLASSAPNRTITFDRAFAPFGELYDTVTGGTSNPDFASLTRDAISDEGDTPNREYHQKQSRWISPDPLGIGAADPGNPQSWNLYAYVMNNPLSATDPSGLNCVEYLGIVGDDGIAPFCGHMTTTDKPDAQVTAHIDAITVDPSSNAWGSLRQAAQTFTNALQSATDAAKQFLQAPRDPGCMAGTMGSGSVIGFGVGGLVGSPGFALGPVGVATESVTVPLGTALGATGGYVAGVITCRTGSGGGGSGSGGGGGGGGSGAGRPKGVPDTWKKVASRNGMDKWVDPNNPHNYVRVRTDGSITQVKNGMALDVNGSPVLQNSAAAHFPASQFVFRP